MRRHQSCHFKRDADGFQTELRDSRHTNEDEKVGREEEMTGDVLIVQRMKSPDDPCCSPADRMTNSCVYNRILSVYYVRISIL